MSHPPRPASCLRLTEAVSKLHAGLDELTSLQPLLETAFARNTLAPSLLDQYKRLLDRLTQADGERVFALKSLGLGDMDMTAALRHCELDDLAEAWGQVREQLPRIAITNRKHAQFLHKATATLQSGLGLLGATGNQPPLYGPSGLKESSLHTRTLGSA